MRYGTHLTRKAEARIHPRRVDVCRSCVELELHGIHSCPCRREPSGGEKEARTQSPADNLFVRGRASTGQRGVRQVAGIQLRRSTHRHAHSPTSDKSALIAKIKRAAKQMDISGFVTPCNSWWAVYHHLHGARLSCETDSCSRRIVRAGQRRDAVRGKDALL